MNLYAVVSVECHKGKWANTVHGVYSTPELASSWIREEIECVGFGFTGVYANESTKGDYIERWEVHTYELDIAYPTDSFVVATRYDQN